MSTRLTLLRLRRIIYVSDTGTGSNLIQAEILDRRGLDGILLCDMRDIRSAFSTKLAVCGTITVYFCMGESRTRVSLGILGESVVPVLFRTTYIDRFIKSTHGAERTIVLHHSAPTHIQMVYEARNEAKSDKLDSRLEGGRDFALFLTPIRCEFRATTIARLVVLKAMGEAPVLVSTQAADLVEVVCHEKVA